MTAPPGLDRAWLLASAEPLASLFDVALLDLDGTVYVGPDPIPGAAEAVRALRAAGVRAAFVTNNASRTPTVVAEHLAALGIECSTEDVVTAAQAGAALVADRVPAGARVLAVGGAGVREALLEVGLEPVSSASDGPLAILQGWTPELAWPLLAEGAYGLAAGLPWVATNTDRTLPTARGIAPGNGSFVALLAGTTGREPDAVAGKPSAPLLRQAVARTRATRPIVVGDRLDTDIEGAATVELPSLLVLTGVTGVAQLLGAPAQHRPAYLSGDVSGLLEPHPAPRVVLGEAGAVKTEWSCGGWVVRVSSKGVLVATTPGRPSSRDDLLRAGCAAAWTSADAGRPVDVDASAAALDEALARAPAAG